MITTIPRAGPRRGPDGDAGTVMQAIDDVADELNDGVQERDGAATFSHEAWRRCADVGLFRLTVPVELGGLGLGPEEAVTVMEHFGRACTDAGLVFAVNSIIWTGVMPLVWFGDADQVERYLGPMCDGELIVGHAMTEPESGSDAFALQTVARRVGDGYELTGQKMLISNAPIADLFLVYARTDPSGGPFGISVFLVERSAPGLRIGPALSTMGLRTATLGSLELDRCHVPGTHLLGGVGGGMALFSKAMVWERGCLLAAGLGVMERQLERGVRRAQQRRQFGRPIGSNQAIAHRLADMRVRVDASRLLVARWAQVQASGRDAAVEASIAKLFVSESLIQSSTSSFEIFGGYGYLSENDVERELRDAFASRIYGGTSEMQRNIIARHLGLS